MEQPATKLDPRTRMLAYVLVLGALTALLDTTIVATAIDRLAAEFDVGVGTIHWVTTGYLLAMTAVIPLTGWAMDRFGPRRMWMLTLAGFSLSSLLCGLAWSIESLIAFRVLKGLAGGMTLPLAQAIMAQAAGPAKLGRAMATMALPGQIAPILGPVVGGLVIDGIGWRWIFLLNIPLGIASVWLARGRIRPGAADGGRSFDLLGAMLLSPGLAALIYGLSGLQPGGSAHAAIFTVVGAAALTAFVIRALSRGATALLDLRLFTDRALAVAGGMTFVFGISLYGPMLLLPLFFQQARGLGALEAGLLLAPQGIGMMAAMAVAGRLADRHPPRLLAVSGILVSLAALYPFATVSQSTSWGALCVAMLVRGFGLGFAAVVVNSAGYRDLERSQIPRAVSAVTILQRIGASGATAVLALILHNELAAAAAGDVGTHAGFAGAFTWTVLLTAPALLLAFLLPGRTARSPQSAGSSPQLTGKRSLAMHAIEQTESGPPEVLAYREVTDPRPGPGQVRIRVSAAGVHLIDTRIRAGDLPASFPAPELPTIPGREVAGVVESVGEGVDPGWIGRAVAAHLGLAGGGYAELAVVAADSLHAVPDGLDPAGAVAMVGTGRTAVAILSLADVDSDDTVLVTGAAGGLGALLVQAAVATGATVIAVVGGVDKSAVARRAGAADTVDHRNPDWHADLVARRGERPVTLLLDGVGGGLARTGLDLLAPGGRAVLFGSASGDWPPVSAGEQFEAGWSDIRVLTPQAITRAGGMRALAGRALDMAGRGLWRPVVEEYPLSRAAAAHTAIESRTSTGKVVLRP